MCVDQDRVMNIIKGALVFAFSGAVVVSFVGSMIGFADLPTGSQLFAFGALWANVLGLFLLPLGFDVQSPELDPSDMPQVDLPTFK